MLERVELINFRCFERFSIEFDKFNVLVGKNNTGKSTIVDALKLISNVVRYSSYRDGYLADRDIPFELTNLRYNYQDNNTIIRAKFSEDLDLSIYFPVDDNPYAEFISEGEKVNFPQSTGKIKRQNVGVIPTVGVFDVTEKLGNKKYLQSVMVSHLTPRHFRNIWYYFNDDFKELLDLLEKTWLGYTIEMPEYLLDQDEMYMFFKENGITREIFWAGHGFQVWLQLLTFLVKLGRVDSLVLDEPDIYLHSDMQKKLVRICRERANQIIIATHAVDIIEEVEPDDILFIDNKIRKAKQLSSIDEVQTVVTELGSAQNLKLVHFYRGRTCLFVEGKDFEYLKILAKTLNISSFYREEGFTVVPLEGFSNWDRLMHINWISKNAFGENVNCYVVLDSDYHTEQEKKEIIRVFQDKKVNSHIWSKKEIENYLIDFEALFRMFSIQYKKRHSKNKLPLTKTQFFDKLQQIIDEFKNYVVSQITASAIINKSDYYEHPSIIIANNLSEFEIHWQDLEFRKNAIPGKEFFSRLNSWLNVEYKIRISVRFALHSLLPEEINREIENVIDGVVALTHSIK